MDVMEGCGVAGNGRVTITEVAREAGVSKATVSVVLNGRTDKVPIGAATQELVFSTAARLGYRPNRAARALSRRRTAILTLLVSNLTNPYYTDIAAAVQAVTATRDYELNVVDAALPGAEAKALENLQGGGADGVIIATVRHTPGHRLLEPVRDLVRHGLPVVLVFDRSPDPAVPAVRIDDEAGGYLATNHLLGLGHRRIAYLVKESRPPLEDARNSSRKADRYRGYRRALAEAGLPFEPAWVLQGPDDTPEVGRDLTRSLLAWPDRGARPTAAFCYNDLLALGALRAAHEAGVRVPADLAVVGFDGIGLGAFSVPALTTVDTPRAALGRRAAEALFELLDGRRPEEPERVLPVGLLVRESCGAAVKGAIAGGRPADWG